MTFVTEPLVCPLGRPKRRAYLRESAFLSRESTNFYGILHSECNPHYWFGLNMFTTGGVEPTIIISVVKQPLDSDFNRVH